MTIPVLSGRWVLLFWECELEKKGELEKHNFTCALQVFHQVTAIIFSQPSIIVWYNLCVQNLNFGAWAYVSMSRPQIINHLSDV